MRNRRDRMCIISDILGVTDEDDPIIKTKIMYKYSLSSTQLNEYLNLLLEKNCIRESEGKFYRTKKGTKLYRILQEFGKDGLIISKTKSRI